MESELGTQFRPCGARVRLERILTPERKSKHNKHNSEKKIHKLAILISSCVPSFAFRVLAPAVASHKCQQSVRFLLTRVPINRQSMRHWEIFLISGDVECCLPV